MLKKLLKVPYWYLIAIPLLSIALGTVSNQVVLWANFDKFPVMSNNEKIHQSCQTPDRPKAPKKDAPSILKPQPAKDSDLCRNGGIFLDDTHVIMTKDSKLKFLADIWDFHEVTYSIGDFFLMFAEWMLSWAPLAWLVLVIRKFIEG